MPDIQIARDVAAPIDTVFEVASDLRNADQHMKGIQSLEVLTPGPIGVGTRFRETRVMHGKEATEEMEVTAFDPPHGYTVEAHSHGMHYVSKFLLAPLDGQTTRLAVEFDSTAETVVSKVLSPLAKMAMGKSLRKALEDDMNDVARVAEARASEG